MTSTIIQFDGHPVKITRKAIKHLYLRLPASGCLSISAPRHFKEERVLEFLEERKDWINKQRQKFQKKTQVPQSLLSGDSVPFKGKAYQLQLQEHSGRPFITLDDKHLIMSIQNEASMAEKQAVLDAWYKHEMMLLIPDLILYWSQIIGVHPTEWRIRKMKTRWGSCNTRAKRIWLSLKLIEKPLCCIELVLVHELVHLLEPSHNQRFYALMTKYLPDWKNYKRQLEGKTKA